MTEQEIGARIARDVWNYIRDQECVELVPWNKDPIELAKEQATKEAFENIKQLMEEKAAEYKNR